MLHAENVESVNYRYGEATIPNFEMCEWAAFHPFSQVQIIKAARCLRLSILRASGLAEERCLQIAASDHRRRHLA